MGQYIKIQGDLIEVIEESVSSRSTLADLMNYLEIEKPLTFPSLPRSAVWTHWNPLIKRLFVLCEMAPGLKTVTKGATEYRISVPWSYFFFVLECNGDLTINSSWSFYNHYLFYSKNRFTFPAQLMLIPAPISNIDGNGGICFGTTGANARQTIADRIDQNVNDFYRSSFNSDLDGRGLTISFREWENATKINLNCWESWSHWEKQKSFEELLKTIGETPRPLLITVPDELSPIPVPFSFGRAEEYLRSLTPEQITRFEVAIQNIRAMEEPVVEMLQPVEEVIGDMTITDEEITAEMEAEITDEEFTVFPTVDEIQ